MHGSPQDDGPARRSQATSAFPDPKGRLRVGCAGSSWFVEVTRTGLAAVDARTTALKNLALIPGRGAMSGRLSGPVIGIDRFGAGVRPGMAGCSPSRSGSRVDLRGERLAIPLPLWAKRANLGNRPSGDSRRRHENIPKAVIHGRSVNSGWRAYYGWSSLRPHRYSVMGRDW
jgi:hypothetical protein